MVAWKIDDLLSNHKISRNVFHHVSDTDLRQCNLVNRSWYHAVRDTKARRKIDISVERLAQLKEKDKPLDDYLKRRFYATDLIIRGWSNGVHVPQEIYDSLLQSKVTARNLILRGRGLWDTCKCPSGNSKLSRSIDVSDLTSIEHIHVTSTFCISSCALLDLISRSPNLKTLNFQGTLSKTEHCESFASKRFSSNLERVYWPWPDSKQSPTLKILVNRNDNILTLHSSSQVICELLATENLTNVRFLSLNLTENWACKPGCQKKVFRHLQKIKYLSMAKNVEALEVRTFEHEENPCSATHQEVERTYEDFQLTFWQQISKLTELKYLAVFGSWELEKVCRLISKYVLQIECLKINLMPTSVTSATAAGNDLPVLSMAEGLRDLRKLTQLRSLHFICYEKLFSLDRDTVSAFKEIMDIIWVLEIKTGFTEETEDLLGNIMRRGNQVGKNYNVTIHVQTKPETNYCNFLMRHNLKFPIGTDLKAKFTSLAESESNDRYGMNICGDIYLWGLDQVGNCRERRGYDVLASKWKLYSEKFQPDLFT